jgi:hypothetical protein
MWRKSSAEVLPLIAFGIAMKVDLRLFSVPLESLPAKAGNKLGL